MKYSMCDHVCVFDNQNQHVCHVHNVFFQSYWSSVPQTLLAGAAKQPVFHCQFFSPNLVCRHFSTRFGGEMARPILMKFGSLGYSSALQKIPHIPPALPSNEWKPSKVGTTCQTLRLLEFHWKAFFICTKLCMCTKLFFLIWGLLFML